MKPSGALVLLLHTLAIKNISQEKKWRLPSGARVVPAPMFQASLTSNLAQSMLDAVKYSNHDKAGDHIFQAPPQAKVGLVVSVNKDSLRPKAPKAWSRESVHIGSEEKAVVAQKAGAWTHQTLLAVHVPEEHQG